jgi:hypothetical protein
MLNKALPEFQSDPISRTIHLESFLIHARNLIDFLEGCGRKNDITCSDFIDDHGNPINPQVTFSKDIKENINKHLAHITKNRLDFKPMWSCSILRNQINQELSKFLTLLPDSAFNGSLLNKLKFTEAVLNKLISN